MSANTQHLTSLNRSGALLVLGSATVWSFGGAIARFLTVQDSWTIVFWRSTFAAIFLLGFMLWRYGWAGKEGTKSLFKAMGWASVGVGLCFTVASISFVTAIQYTSIANVLLMQAGVPLIAALASFLLFGERVERVTWVAISVVIAGVGWMVSDSLTGQVSPMGDSLALLVALAFAGATLITRRHAALAMMPAVFFGCVVAGLIAAGMANKFTINPVDTGLLFVFGALNLGLGLAMFVSGVRLVPAAIAALIGVAEPVLGPVWVWLIHSEVPSESTLWGGGLVFIALVSHLVWQLRKEAILSLQ